MILGEGDSEQILLPKLASAMELDVDPSFVAIVPLGGRHVNHFWKLLNDLKIPYATLLDLDIERHNGGWGRIKDAVDQLIAIGKDLQSGLKYQNNQGEEIEITYEQLKTLPKENAEIDKDLLTHLEEKFCVFYSEPLDIDMMMLSSFPDCYKKIGSHPRSSIDAAQKAVLGEQSNLDNYPTELKELLPWYSYLFLGKKSKPSTHLQALCNIESSGEENILKEKMPSVLTVNQKVFPKE